MRKLCYLVVEGPHDVEFACRLIKSRAALMRVRQHQDLDSAMAKLVPDKFPHGGDLLRRVPVPVFLQNDAVAIAIHAAGGDSKIVDCLAGTFDILQESEFAAIGVILDSDSATSPSARHQALRTLARSLPISFADQPGELLSGPPRTGVYVLPDNTSQGTLEDLLLECGQLVYPKQVDAAKEFVRLAFAECPRRDFSDLHLPAGRQKATVGAVASLLRPGKAMQVSIQDNKWLDAQGIQLPRLVQAADFLDKLFGLTVP